LSVTSTKPPPSEQPNKAEARTVGASAAEAAPELHKSGTNAKIAASTNAATERLRGRNCIVPLLLPLVELTVK
jgi:hypothetical protein